MSSLERKNGWSLAEFAGDARPDGMQRLLNHARWDADLVRNALRRQVGERIGSLSGVLVVDDTGFEKKGRRSARVQRQYTGAAGKITNCQIGVFFAVMSNPVESVRSQGERPARSRSQHTGGSRCPSPPPPPPFPPSR
ncbi:hypothetical protein Airi02_078970 [Actinoallomurus iriomotensis]|uniref:Transposase IS701-like DDE domain-containing protein n=1 Tax=Actinoallomurus iriomotensis TaxID=478107 RepID=A0A9W6SAB9_9ACTN|nr:hypothetical protein Airi02_078970 [Actinoallomurus iriomotensis]